MMPAAPVVSPPALAPALLRLPRGLAACDIAFGDFDALADWDLAGRRPRVTAEPRASRVTVAVRRMRPIGRSARGRITLAADRCWTIECGHGLADVTIDASRPAFAGLAVAGGTSRLRVLLGVPAEPVRLRFAGGASHVELVREPGLAARLRFAGAHAGVRVDGARHTSGRGGDVTAGAGRTLLECEFESGAAHVSLSEA